MPESLVFGGDVLWAGVAGRGAGGGIGTWRNEELGA